MPRDAVRLLRPPRWKRIVQCPQWSKPDTPRQLPTRATCTISRNVSDEDPGPETRSKAFVWMMGICALLVWFAALWFMFGDVL